MYVFRKNSYEAERIASGRPFRKCVESGRIVAVGHRWYATEPVTGKVKIACENGLLISCLTALKEYGLWTPYDETDHYIANNHGSIKQLPKTVVHRCMKRSAIATHIPPARAQNIIVPLADAVEQALFHHDAETGLIILDSLLNQRKITPSGADIIISHAQIHKQRILKRYISTSQSGSETRVRNYLVSKNYHVAPQTLIEGVGRVDLLVGQSLIIECDSTAFHSQSINVLADRERDLQAKMRGYSVLRLSYEHVWHRWQETQYIIDRFLHNGQHRTSPTPIVMRA